MSDFQNLNSELKYSPYTIPKIIKSRIKLEGL